jgi:hypothetical protein
MGVLRKKLKHTVIQNHFFLEILINVKKAGAVKQGARKVYHGRRVGQACSRASFYTNFRFPPLVTIPSLPRTQCRRPLRCAISLAIQHNFTSTVLRLGASSLPLGTWLATEYRSYFMCVRAFVRACTRWNEIRAQVLHSEIHVTVKWRNIPLSSVTRHDITQRVVMRIQDTVHSRGQLWSNNHGIQTWRILWHAPNPRYLY